MRVLLLLLGLVLGCEGMCAWEHEAPMVTADMLVKRDAESRAQPWLGASDDNIVAVRDARAADAASDELCERYAEVATRVVNGWYPTGFDRASYGGFIWTFATTSVPDRKIEWSCSPEGLHLELNLPAYDRRHESADDALADILSALPWRGLDAKADGMRIVVTLVRTVDEAVFTLR